MRRLLGVTSAHGTGSVAPFGGIAHGASFPAALRRPHIEGLLPAQSPPWPRRCRGSLLGYCSLLGKGILTCPLGLGSVNLADSLSNPLSKCQVGFKFNFDGINIQQGVGNLDLSFPGCAAGPCPPPPPTCPSSNKAWR